MAYDASKIIAALAVLENALDRCMIEDVCTGEVSAALEYLGTQATLHLDVAFDDGFVDTDCGHKESLGPDFAAIPVQLVEETELCTKCATGVAF